MAIWRLPRRKEKKKNTQVGEKKNFNRTRRRRERERRKKKGKSEALLRNQKSTRWLAKKKGEEKEEKFKIIDFFYSETG